MALSVSSTGVRIDGYGGACAARGGDGRDRVTLRSDGQVIAIFYSDLGLHTYEQLGVWGFRSVVLKVPAPRGWGITKTR